MDWTYVVNALKFYSELMVRPMNESLRRSSSSSFIGSGPPSSDGGGPMAYYDYATPKVDSWSTAESTVTPKKDATVVSSSSSVPTSDKWAMDEAMKLHILSLLKLISHVVVHCQVAKMFLLEISLPSLAANDDVLSVLFALSKSSIPHDVRGAVLSVIADLIRCDHFNHLSKDEQSFIVSIGRRAWDLLEESNVIPVSVICQYKSMGLSIPSNVQGMRSDAGFKVRRLN